MVGSIHVNYMGDGTYLMGGSIIYNLLNLQGLEFILTKDQKIESLIKEVSTLTKRINHLTEFCDVTDQKVELLSKQCELMHKALNILDRKADELIKEEGI